jgi:hypothetical protein
MEVLVIFMLNVNLHQQKSGQDTDAFSQERPILSFLHCRVVPKSGTGALRHATIRKDRSNCARNGRRSNFQVSHGFQMDDSLEQPNASPDPIESPDRLDADDENSSGDEDGGLDWTKLL